MPDTPTLRDIAPLPWKLDRYVREGQYWIRDSYDGLVVKVSRKDIATAIVEAMNRTATEE